MDKTASPWRLRQSVQTYFDDPWAPTYANADRPLDGRCDEEMALRRDEVTSWGALPDSNMKSLMRSGVRAVSGHH